MSFWKPTRSSPVSFEAKDFIREQDVKTHGFLWGHFTKLHPDGE